MVWWYMHGWDVVASSCLSYFVFEWVTCLISYIVKISFYLCRTIALIKAMYLWYLLTLVDMKYSLPCIYIFISYLISNILYSDFTRDSHSNTDKIVSKCHYNEGLHWINDLIYIYIYIYIIYIWYGEPVARLKPGFYYGLVNTFWVALYNTQNFNEWQGVSEFKCRIILN